MYLMIANKNVKEAYPLVARLANMVTYFEKETGLDMNVIELNTAEDILSLDAAARASDSLYDGLFIRGTTIALLRNGEILEK